MIDNMPIAIQFPDILTVRIHKLDGVSSAERIRRKIEVFLGQGIDSGPPDPIFRIIHPRTIVDIGNGDKCLLLLAVISVTIVCYRRLGILPPQPEGVIIVLLEHLTLIIDDNPHTPQMVRNEIAGFQSTGSFYKSPAVESRTFHFQRLARGRAFVYQRAHIAQTTSIRSRGHVFCPFAR